MFEHRSQSLLSRKAFVRRMLQSSALCLLVISVSLAIGVLGYHSIAQLSWIDSLLNATMILASMGPVDVLQTDGAKLFASFYALFSGIGFITSISLILAPIVHRILHSFHIDFGNE